MPRIEFQHLTRGYRSGGGLFDLSLTIEPEESFVLIGPNGSGKTTCFRVLAGLEPRDSGRILIDGCDISDNPPHLRQIAYVTQKPALFPYLTVGENLAFPNVRRWRAKNTDVHAAIVAIADRLHFRDWLSRYPEELSAGEQQRIAIGQLLARRAAIWLLDEPFANLDPPIRAEFSRELHLLRGEFRATMMLITHDPNEAMAIGQRIGVLGEGQLIQVGTPAELLARPGSRFVAYCLSRPPINLIDGRIATRSDGATCFRSLDGALEVALAGDVPTGAMTLAVHPEAIRLGTIPTGSLDLGEWQCCRCEPWSDRRLVMGRRGTSELRWLSDTANGIGSQYRCWAFTRDVVFFDTTTGRLAHPRT